MAEIGRFKRIYVDANIFIYLIEGSGEIIDRAEEVIVECAHNDVEIVISALTISECLVKPYSKSDERMADIYESYLSQFAVEPLSDAMVISASKLAGENRIKLFDAIHVEASRSAQCDGFLTNDKALSNRLKKPDPILFSDIGSG
ncbi:MAG: type II toxin-antitoxin system VapC family toxin [Pseudomonadota bacterium]